MANAFNQEEVILFEQVLEKFDSDNTIAKQATMFRQPGSEMQRRGDTVWRPQPQISTIVEGLDITGNIGSITGMTVPATLSTIANVPFQMNLLEMRDPLQRDRKATSAAQALSARINRAIADNVKIWGSQTVQVVGALTGYDNVSLIDALYTENDVIAMNKTLVLAPRSYNLMAANLASRTLMTRSERALSDNNLGPISGFNTFKTSYTPAVPAQGAAPTVTGNQSHVPVSTSTAATGETENVDNRTFNLVVSSTAGLNPGDKFNIANVNAISLINKKDTALLKGFSIVSIVDGTNMLISPAPVAAAGGSDAEIDYANVDSIPQNAAVLTFLNNTATDGNVHFVNDSIEIFGGTLAWDDMAGVATMRQTTDTGIEIIFAKQGDVLTGITTYRLTMFFGTTNLVPEMNGLLIGNQV